MRALSAALLCISVAGCASDTPEQAAARSAALGRMGAIIASGGVQPAPVYAPPPPNILPPPPVRCTSSQDYMGQIHTTCR